MPYSAAVLAGVLFAIGGALALPGVRGPLGLGLDGSWQMALVHAEIALAPLVFWPRKGGRAEVFHNLAVAASCWAVGTAVILLFSFASIGDAALKSRGLSAVVWLAAAGLVTAGARVQRAAGARALLLAMFGLPVMWHYFALEYGGASLIHLRGLSPNWALAAGSPVRWPLALVGVAAWGAAFALPRRQEAT